MAKLGLFLTLLAAAGAPAPDTLVVCPAEFREALAPWEQFRRDQGHQLAVIEPPKSAEQLRGEIRHVAESGRLKFVLLVGDVLEPTLGLSSPRRVSDRKERTVLPVVPTDYVEARVNIHWGSEPTIATDQSFADVDGDRVPDVAVGRLPVDSPEELTAVVRKILRYENEASFGAWRRRVHVVAGVGGFGRLADALIEAAARRVIGASVPVSYEIEPTLASPTSPCCPPPGAFTAHVCRQLSEGSFAWIYLGHGLPTTLDRVSTPAGLRPILSVEDVRHVHCPAESPVAVLVACYTGAFDAPVDCLAEEMAVREQGPVAVIAATRVTMPYGNAVFGHELLQACFIDRAATLGEVWLQAGRRTVADAPDDALRKSLDALANSVAPVISQTSGSLQQSNDLADERHEHVLMYQLFGDPLLSLRLPQKMQLQTAGTPVAGQPLTVSGQTNVVGHCEFELVEPNAAGKERVVGRWSRLVDGSPFRAQVPLPTAARGEYIVRAYVSGDAASAAGAVRVTIEHPAEVRIASGHDRSTVK